MAIKTINDFKEFETEADKLGVQEDLRALLTLDANFVERYRNYVVINLKDYGPEPNNLLILGYESSLLYSGKQVGERDFSLFRFTLKKKYGESTVLTLLTLRKVLQNYTQRFEELNAEIDKLEAQPQIERLESVGRYLRKLTDRVEDLIDVIIKLEERRIREVNTQFVSYDWDLLQAEAQHMLDRCRRRIALLTGLRSEADIRTTIGLNQRIEYLSEVMKRLTGLTVLLMVPTVIVSAWSMNFKIIPLAQWDYGFPAAVGVALGVTLLIALYMRRRQWI